MIDFGTIKQGSRPAVAFAWPLETGHEPSDLTGFVVSGTLLNKDTEFLTAVTGALTVVDGVTRSMTWRMAAEDTGTAGEFLVVLYATNGLDSIYTLNGSLVIEPNPAVVSTSGQPQVGVPQDDADWLAYQPQVRGFFMQRTSIDADETVTIPAGHAMVTTLPFENDGSIEVNGRLTILGGAAEASREEFGAAAAVAVYDHNNSREGVHGIADTRLLETQAEAQAKADAALAAALAALLSHESDVTNPHEVTAAQAGADSLGSATAAQAAAIAASVPRIPAVNYRSSTVYTFVLTDDNKTVTSNSSSATTFTIPLSTSAAFPIGAIIWLEQHGAGALTIAATAGVTLNSLLSKKTLAGRYATAMLKKTSTNIWLLSGDLI